jgi:hypothetical protein
MDRGKLRGFDTRRRIEPPARSVLGAEDAISGRPIRRFDDALERCHHDAALRAATLALVALATYSESAHPARGKGIARNWTGEWAQSAGPGPCRARIALGQTRRRDPAARASRLRRLLRGAHLGGAALFKSRRPDLVVVGCGRGRGRAAGREIGLGIRDSGGYGRRVLSARRESISGWTAPRDRPRRRAWAVSSGR